MTAWLRAALLSRLGPVLAGLLPLAACSNSNANPTTITVSPAAVSLTAPVGGTPAPQTVTATYDGDIHYYYNPNAASPTTLPSWLTSVSFGTVTTNEDGSHSAPITLTGNTSGLAAGSYDVTLRIGTARGTTETNYSPSETDLTITLVVTTP